MIEHVDMEQFASEASGQSLEQRTAMELFLHELQRFPGSCMYISLLLSFLLFEMELFPREPQRFPGMCA